MPESFPIERFFGIISNNEIVKASVKEAKDKVFAVTKSRSNACAATVSTLLMKAGIAKKTYFLTEDLAKFLLSIGAQKVTKIEELQIGDICFSKDLNQNGMPDHVWVHIKTNPGKNSPCLIIDNYDTKPHIRNYENGPRTPFAYALKLPRPSQMNTSLINKAFDSIVTLYDVLADAPIDKEEMQVILKHLNDIRYSKTFKDLKR